MLTVWYITTNRIIKEKAFFGETNTYYFLVIERSCRIHDIVTFRKPPPLPLPTLLDLLICGKNKTSSTRTKLTDYFYN